MLVPVSHDPADADEVLAYASGSASLSASVLGVVSWGHSAGLTVSGSSECSELSHGDGAFSGDARLRVKEMRAVEGE